MNSTNKAWYSVKVRVGKEDKTISAIKMAAEIRSLQDYFGEMFAAKATRQTGDKKTTTNLYPGYIFINAVMNNEVKDVVTSTANVTGFVGDKKNPAVIGDHEVEKILSSMGGGQTSTAKKIQILFSEGDKVRLLRLNVDGLVKKIEGISGKITVATELFGRSVDTVVSSDQIEKI